MAGKARVCVCVCVYKEGVSFFRIKENGKERHFITVWCEYGDCHVISC